MNIGIYGAGNFGFALAYHLGKGNENHQFAVYDENKNVRDSLIKTRINPYVDKNKKIDSKIKVYENKESFIKKADVLILAIPSKELRKTAKEISSWIKINTIIVNTAKALDSETGDVFSKTFKELIKKKHKFAFLSGGMISKDLIDGNHLSATIASRSKKTRNTLKNIFESDKLQIQLTNDLYGAECSGAFKNILSTYMGILEGKNTPSGTKIFLLTEMIEKLEKLGVKEFKAKKETFKMSTPCWGNDILISCFSKTRNKEFGKIIGMGTRFEQDKIDMIKTNKTVEVFETIKAAEKNKELKKIINEVLTQ